MKDYPKRDRPAYPMKDLTVRRGREEWVFAYEELYHALKLESYSVEERRVFDIRNIRGSIRYHEVPLPDGVKEEALKRFCESLQVIRGWPDAQGWEPVDEQ